MTQNCPHCIYGSFQDNRFGQNVECVNGVLVDIDEAHEGAIDIVRPVAPCHPCYDKQKNDPDAETWNNDSIERLTAWRKSEEGPKNLTDIERLLDEIEGHLAGRDSHSPYLFGFTTAEVAQLAKLARLQITEQTSLPEPMHKATVEHAISDSISSNTSGWRGYIDRLWAAMMQAKRTHAQWRRNRSTR